MCPSISKEHFNSIKIKIKIRLGIVNPPVKIPIETLKTIKNDKYFVTSLQCSLYNPLRLQRFAFQIHKLITFL